MDISTQPRAKKPRKERTVDSKEDCAAIGKYAAENGNAHAQKSKLPELGVCSFKPKYPILTIASGKNSITGHLEALMKQYILLL